MASSELGPTGSVWQVDRQPNVRQPLDRDLDTDVVVIGAGIAGLSAAYELARTGARVVVLEAREVGAGNTGQTTAHLASAVDDRFYELERLHGADGARLAYESHARAIERIGEIAALEGIDCDYQRLDGYLFLAPEHGRDLLERELAAARRAGFSDTELLERAPGATFETGPCLRFPRQGRLHALRYLDGLALAVERAGGLIFTASPVSDGGGGPAWARTREGHTVRGKTLVMATNSPIFDRVAVHAKQEPYMTYVVAGAIPADGVPDQLLWDTGDPYHYVRRQRLGDGRVLLIVGGEDHRTGDGPDDAAPFVRLVAWARQRFPIGEPELRWSGMVYEPVDALAYIGRNPGDDDVLVATGDSGQGITHGAIAGMLLADLALGRENEWETLYDPSRKTLRAAGEMARGGMEMALEYGEWLWGAEGQVGSAEEIAPGSGGIVRRGARPLAVYRDEDGRAHVRSAVCRHLGCIVHWNAVERSWDCGCHGSRYTATGEVIQGPARSDLETVED